MKVVKFVFILDTISSNCKNSVYFM